MGWLSECHTVFLIQTLGFCKGFSGNLPLILISLVCWIGAPPKIILFVFNIHPKIFAQLAPPLPLPVLWMYICDRLIAKVFVTFMRQMAMIGLLHQILLCLKKTMADRFS